MFVLTDGLMMKLLMLAFTDEEAFLKRMNGIFEQHPEFKKQYDKFVVKIMAANDGVNVKGGSTV